MNRVVAISREFGSPLSIKMTCKMFNPERNHPMIFETVIIFRLPSFLRCFLSNRLLDSCLESFLPSVMKAF